MRILHIASHSINMGDGAIHAGMNRALRDVLGNYEIILLDHVAHDMAGKEITFDLIKSINPDHIIIGGGGAIDCHERLNGTAVPISLRTFERLNIPVTFLALGHNMLYGQEMKPLSAEGLQNLINICEKKGWGFSVRNDGSLIRLSQQLDAHYVQKVCDPGFFIEADENFRPLIDGKYVLIQATFDYHLEKFGRIEEAKLFASNIARYIRWLNANGYCTILATHTLYDITSAHNIIVSSDEKIRFGNYVTGFLSPLFAPQFFNYYKQAKLVVGMRGHSVICGAGLGTPTIGINNQYKIGGFMKNVGLEQFCVQPNDIERLQMLTAMLLNKEIEYPDLTEVRQNLYNELCDFLANEFR
jgi:polysaccharide pyruvyl transferase WcaK-like protein